MKSNIYKILALGAFSQLGGFSMENPRKIRNNNKFELSSLEKEYLKTLGGKAKKEFLKNLKLRGKND